MRQQNCPGVEIVSEGQRIDGVRNAVQHTPCLRNSLSPEEPHKVHVFLKEFMDIHCL